jgi:hypothetical protein
VSAKQVERDRDDPITVVHQMMESAIEAAGDHFAVPVVAMKLVEQLRRENMGLLIAYLNARAALYFTLDMSRHLRGQRQSARVQARRHRFHEDPAAFYHSKFAIDEHGNRKELCDMTGVDHRFVASEYRRDANKDLLEASFHEALARKLGDKRTSDVYTAEQVAEMYSTFAEERSA